MKTQKKTSATSTLFRPGSTGQCEAQLWLFMGAPENGAAENPHGDNGAEVHWVAAESLDQALRYMRQRYAEFIITEVRFLEMIALLAGAPLD